MNVILHTLGCKVNQYETEVIRETFLNRGYTSATEPPADIVVINSCTVTAESDRKTRQLVRRSRRENPNAVIVLTGCMAQAFPEDAAGLGEVDIIAGNTDPGRIVTLAEQYARTGERLIEIQPHKTGEAFRTGSISDFSERTRAYIKIEDGCDRFCSYCIIPSARGRVRSRALPEIYDEALRLSEKGFYEIVLTGINLSAYGKGEGFDLCDAVEAVSACPKIRRVRLGSLEPDHITDDMLGRLRAQEKFCPQFHLSLQSGCDAILHRMNRHYNGAFYRKLIERIRAIFPDAAITTDIMVGFAGESEDEFRDSLRFVESIGFAKAHIFMYSRRSGTVAAALPGQVSRAEKERRSEQMMAVTRRSEADFLAALRGQTVSVLFETRCDGYNEGYTPNYSRVRVLSDRDLRGNICQVEITDSADDYCIGQLLPDGL